jgi:hypothetical protein
MWSHSPFPISEKKAYRPEVRERYALCVGLLQLPGAVPPAASGSGANEKAQITFT